MPKIFIFKLGLTYFSPRPQTTVAQIGLFLHTPFPSSEIFRTLSKRDDLLRGMLSADQIGFHLYEYVACEHVHAVPPSLV